MIARTSCPRFAILLVALVSWYGVGGTQRVRGQDADTLPEPPRPPSRFGIPDRPAPPEPVAPRPVPAAGTPVFGTPVPGAPISGAPIYGGVISGPVELYPHVRVKDARKIAPGAVKIVIAVRDPNASRKGPAGSVFVMICVPAGPPRKVDVNRHGNQIEFDFGKYEVDISSRDGVVTIDYDD